MQTAHQKETQILLTMAEKYKTLEADYSILKSDYNSLLEDHKMLLSEVHNLEEKTSN